MNLQRLRNLRSEMRAGQRFFAKARAKPASMPKNCVS